MIVNFFIDFGSLSLVVLVFFSRMANPTLPSLETLAKTNESNLILKPQLLNEVFTLAFILLG